MRRGVKPVIFILALVIFQFTIQIPGVVKATTFTSPAALPNPDSNDNSGPVQTVAPNGYVWLAWTRENFITFQRDIWYMVNNGHGWGGSSNATSGPASNRDPALASLNNGTILLVYAANQTSVTQGYDLYIKSNNAGQWSSASPLVQAPGDDLQPSMTRLNDGRIILVWCRRTLTNGGGDLFYKILTGSSWGPETPLAASPTNQETMPSVTQTLDGRVWVAYEADYVNYTGHSALYYKTWNLQAWSNWTQLTVPIRVSYGAGGNFTSNDVYPSIVQDRGGTIWLFWTRNVPPSNSTNPYEYTLYFMNSTNNGATWSQLTPIAVEPASWTTPIYDDKQPSVVMGPDKTLWIVWATDRQLGSYNTFNLWQMKSSYIPAHIIGIAGLQTSVSNPRTGETLNVTVTISNPGDFNENTNVTLYLNSTVLAKNSVTVSAGQSKSTLFRWNTVGYTLGHYTLAAYVQPAPNQLVLQNLWLNDTSHILTFRGDANRDGKVNILDLSLVGSHMGVLIGAGNYVPDADLNHDGVINIIDLVMCAQDFGKSL